MLVSCLNTADFSVPIKQRYHFYDFLIKMYHRNSPNRDVRESQTSSLNVRRHPFTLFPALPSKFPWQFFLLWALPACSAVSPVLPTKQHGQTHHSNITCSGFQFLSCSWARTLTKTNVGSFILSYTLPYAIERSQGRSSRWQRPRGRIELKQRPWGNSS